MPYLPVAQPPQNEILASAERRWRALIDLRPDLEPAVKLQRGLLTLVIDLAATVDSGRLPRLSLPPKYLAVKLTRGVPILSGEPIPLPAPLLKASLVRFCAELAAGGSDLNRFRHSRKLYQLSAVSYQLSASLDFHGQPFA